MATPKLSFGKPGAETDSSIWTTVHRHIMPGEIYIPKPLQLEFDQIVDACLNDAVFGKSTRLSGVLLKGPPGTGKTYTTYFLRTWISMLLDRDLTEDAVPLLQVNSFQAPEDVSTYFNELRKQAKARGLAMGFHDEIEALGKREGYLDPQKAAILNTYLVEVDGKSDNSGVILIGATNKPNMLDSAFRRGKRFGYEVYFDPLDREGRMHVANIHAGSTNQFSYAQGTLDRLVERTHGAVGADINDLISRTNMRANTALLNGIEALAQRYLLDEASIPFNEEISALPISEEVRNNALEREAWVRAQAREARTLLPAEPKEYERKLHAKRLAKRVFDGINPNGSDRPEAPKRWINVGTTHIEPLLDNFHPSALKDTPLEEAKVAFDAFGGVDSQISVLRRIVEQTIAKSENGTSIYLYGPKGHGVTDLARAIAGEFHYNLIALYGADTENMYVGSQKDTLIEINDKARASQPTIFLFDNIRYLAQDTRGTDMAHKQAATSALHSIIRPTKGVLYIATGERPLEAELDISTRSLFSIELYVPGPQELSNETTRGDAYRNIWGRHLGVTGIDERLDITDLAVRSASRSQEYTGLTGGDVAAICNGFRTLGIAPTQDKLGRVIEEYRMLDRKSKSRVMELIMQD